jgi:glycosyltransferase involved in cell wall biosynthesis
MIHIAIDARRIRDFGIGTYIRSLIHALGQVDRRNRYTIITGPSEVSMLDGLPETFRIAIYKRNDHAILDHVAFPAFLHGLHADLVHIPLNRVPLFMIRPYVVTIHDLTNIVFEAEASDLRMQMRRFRFRRGLARAQRVIAVSDSTKRDVEKVMGIPSERIRRVYNAPDPAFFSRATGPGGEQQRIMERYQITYPYLLYAGNIRRHKNIPRLIEAFAVVRSQLVEHPVYKDLRLVVIGDSISQYPFVRQAVIKSRVENLVRFLGFVPFDTLRCFYESAAAFVFPSRYEGFGLPPLEAMACGTPVVSSNASSLPEVVGDAAILVHPEKVFEIAKGIKEVLTDDELRAKLIRRGREQAARFSWNWTARQVLEIYEEAVN